MRIRRSLACLQALWFGARVHTLGSLEILRFFISLKSEELMQHLLP